LKKKHHTLKRKNARALFFQHTRALSFSSVPRAAAAAAAAAATVFVSPLVFFCDIAQERLICVFVF